MLVKRTHSNDKKLFFSFAHSSPSCDKAPIVDGTVPRKLFCVIEMATTASPIAVLPQMTPAQSQTSFAKSQFVLMLQDTPPRLE
jgi:hypothetical protein